MKKNIYLSFLIILAVSFLISANLSAGTKDNQGKHKNTSMPKVTDNPGQSLIDVNQITCWTRNDGYHDWVVGGSWDGAFPNGVNAGAIFSEGIVWGGFVNDGTSPSLRVNGNTYATGCASVTRLYRVRPDYQNGDLTQDAADYYSVAVTSVTSSDIQALKDQYGKDWNEWPANDGAPYNDVNGNGQYDPTVDIPGIPGASQTLFIKYNDPSSNSLSLYGSPSIGLDITETYWAYATAGALGNVIFKKVDIVYVGTASTPSNASIDSMYIVQWADPDVGNSTDDFAGCDTTLNLGYAYSSGATDAVYQSLNLAPPAVGYDFLQGVSHFTGNPDDSAIFNLKWRHGYAYTNPKPMSSYAYFAAGGTWGDPAFTYTGTQEFYNLMRGKKPDPPYPSGDPFPTSVADVTPNGTYLLDGDPVFGTGKIDGSVDGPGDRRIMVTNGPITMNLHDTAQVVLALIGGLGKNNLSSISTLKYNDAFAQYAYDQLFDIPLMPKPNVTAQGLNDRIVLDWSGPDSLVNAIENNPHGPYEFEAYSVYQLPPGGTDITQGVRIATFDVVNSTQVLFDKVLDENTGLIYIKPIVFLNNSAGIQRYLTITEDQIFNKPLANGLNYTFAVTAIAYKNDPGLPSFQLESSPTIVNVTPQVAPPGTTYGSVNGDTISVVHATGHSDGAVFPIVLDPSKTDGHNYKVTFDTLGGGYIWNLTDVTTNTVALADQINQSGDENYAIFKGMLIKVVGPPIAVNGYTFTPSADRWFTGYAGLGGEAFFGGLTIGANFFGSNITPDQYVKVEIRFTTNVSDGQRAYRYLRGGTPNYGYSNYELQNFTVWNVESNPPVQLAAAYVEQNGGPAANSLWQPTADPNDREYLFILNTPYTEAPDAFYTSKSLLADAGDIPMLYGLWPLQRGSMPYNPQDGQVFTIIPNYANTPVDNFTFTAPTVTLGDNNVAKDEVKMINVFPNPYYGFQYRESSRDLHYVTFSHLPQNAVIRIFDLSGVLVRTINHHSSSPNSQFDTWNLQNDSNYPVASGIYVVYIDMPDLGTTKILKLAVIQEQQILKVY